MTQAPSIKEALKAAMRAFKACRPIERVACQDFGMQQDGILEQQLEAALSAALATIQPDGERREAIARPANRIWFDTEFIEDGKTIDLISIGLVRSDGATYYSETDDWIPGKASQWVKDNVLVHLRGGDAIKPRDVIAREIVEFVGVDPEFWAYYADYDWVALCQLYGTMMHLPEGWPMFCLDIKQLCVDLCDPKLPEKTSTEHHALADAQWNKQAWDFLASGLVQDEAGWQPIDTAPKDHLPILTWSEQKGRCVAFRDVTRTWWPCPATEPLSDKPTHWMPLPASPIRSARDGGEG